jgi:hypothetical protein
MTRHALAGAAEALLVYAWLNGHVTMDECVAVMGKAGEAVEGLSALLVIVKKRVTFP